LREKYRCEICRKEFVKDVPDWQSYLLVNCPHCLSKPLFHVKIGGRRNENFLKTFEHYLILKHMVEPVEFPFWDKLVGMLGSDIVSVMTKRKDESFKRWEKRLKNAKKTKTINW